MEMQNWLEMITRRYGRSDPDKLQIANEIYLKNPNASKKYLEIRIRGAWIDEYRKKNHVVYPKQSIDYLEESVYVHQVASRINGRSREILELRIAGHRIKDIAEKYKITSGRVVQVLRDLSRLL